MTRAMLWVVQNQMLYQFYILSDGYPNCAGKYLHNWMNFDEPNVAQLLTKENYSFEHKTDLLKKVYNNIRILGDAEYFYIIYPEVHRGYFLKYPNSNIFKNVNQLKLAFLIRYLPYKELSLRNWGFLNLDLYLEKEGIINSVKNDVLPKKVFNLKKNGEIICSLS